jgi:HPt (histidine-containing phosphotransfer) domain-containing protein
MADKNNQDLDLSLLNEIADGSDEFIVDSITMFLEQTPIALAEIANNIAAGNWTEAGASAHKIKATLGFFGMLNTQALIQQVETECKAGGAADTSSKFAEAKKIIESNIPALQQIQAEASARL